MPRRLKFTQPDGQLVEMMTPRKHIFVSSITNQMSQGGALDGDVFKRAAPARPARKRSESYARGRPFSEPSTSIPATPSP